MPKPKHELQNLVSVVIPTYNRAHCVRETLESVLSQTHQAYEIVIVDDGSTDGTSEALRPYYDRIRYIYQDNHGLAHARNRGISEARGEWIAFLDSDDVWLPNKLEVQLQGVRNNPDAVVHVTNATIYREHLHEEVNLYNLTGFRAKADCLETFLPSPLIPCVSFGLAWMQCALVRKTTFLNVGEFKPSLKVYLDFEMGGRLSLVGPWIAQHLPLVRILRQDEGQVKSISTTSTTNEGREELIEVYQQMGRLQGLRPREEAFLRRRKCDAMASLGLRLVLNGSIQKGRLHLWHAFLQCKRPAALIKALVAYAPPRARRQIVSKHFPYACN